MALQLIRVEDVNKIGIMRDGEPYRLPLNAWSDGNNIQFVREAAHKGLRWIKSRNTSTITDARGIFRGFTGSGNVWCYAGQTGIRAFDDSTDADITRVSGPYTGTDSDVWQAVEFNEMLFLTNGIDLPQLWNPPGVSQKLIDLTNWPGSTYCKNIRAFLNFLIALHVKEGGVDYPQMVKWSTNAAQGSVPSSWDQTDPTKLAGEYNLMDSPGACLDAVRLGNQLVIYKEDAVWVMIYIGGNLIFGFQPLFTNFGLMAPNCAVDLGDRHFVATRDDVLTHNGSTWQSLLEMKGRRWLFNNIDPSAFKFAFTIHRKSHSEIWLCFPMIGSQSCTTALIWNYKYNTITYNDLPGIRGAVTTPAIQASVGDSWDGDAVTTWDGETTLIWDDPSFLKVAERDFMLSDFQSGVQNEIYEFADTVLTDPDVGNYVSFLIKQDIDVASVATYASGIAVIRDTTKVKTLLAVYPKITETKGVVINVYVAAKMLPQDPLVWQGPFPYTIGTTEKVDCWVTGRYFSVKFSDDGQVASKWDLQSYELEVSPLGRF